MNKPIENWESTDKFMEMVGIVKTWFEDEELEVADNTIGRMASRLQSLLSKTLKQEIARVGEEIIREDKSDELFEDPRDAFAHVGAETLRAQQRKHLQEILAKL